MNRKNHLPRINQLVLLTKKTMHYGHKGTSDGIKKHLKRATEAATTSLKLNVGILLI